MSSDSVLLEFHIQGRLALESIHVPFNEDLSFKILCNKIAFFVGNLLYVCKHQDIYLTNVPKEKLITRNGAQFKTEC